MIDKPIQYINRDFNSFKSQLINFAKTYYPSTYEDISINIIPGDVSLKSLYVDG